LIVQFVISTESSSECCALYTLRTTHYALFANRYREEQLAWLEADLQAANAPSQRRKVSEIYSSTQTASDLYKY
jgi:hypothetical protein